VAIGIGKGQHARDRSPDRAKNPSRGQPHKNIATGLSENPKKRIEM